MHYKYTDIKAIVAEILENKKDEGGVKNIYFVGCGGSLGALYPAKTFMERESLTLKSGWVSSNEFVHSTPRDFGKNSIICLLCQAVLSPLLLDVAQSNGVALNLCKCLCDALTHSASADNTDLHRKSLL